MILFFFFSRYKLAEFLKLKAETNKHSNKLRVAFILQLVTVYLSLCSYLYFIYTGSRCDASILFEMVYNKVGQ